MHLSAIQQHHLRLRPISQMNFFWTALPVSVCLVASSRKRENCAVLCSCSVHDVGCIATAELIRCGSSVSSDADLHHLTTLCSTYFKTAQTLSSSLSDWLSFSGNPARPLVCWRAGSWSRGGGIHVPVLRTSAGPCRAPAPHRAPALPVWKNSFSAA